MNIPLGISEGDFYSALTVLYMIPILKRIVKLKTYKNQLAI